MQGDFFIIHPKVLGTVFTLYRKYTGADVEDLYFSKISLKSAGWVCFGRGCVPRPATPLEDSPLTSQCNFGRVQ
jgi:hypothetical protein